MDKPNGHHRGPIPTETPAAIVAAGVAIPENALTLKREPEVVIAEAKRAAEALIAHVNARPDDQRYKIDGELFLGIDDWQMLARFYNTTPAVVPGSVKAIEFGDVIGFEAFAEALAVVDGHTVRVSSGDGMCLNDEHDWRDRPLHQLRSMAQTRACGKALRNALGWVMKLAGYRTTPAEEMEKPRNDAEPIIAPPRRLSETRQDPPRQVHEVREVREPEYREPEHEDRRPAPRPRYQQRYDHYHRSGSRSRRYDARDDRRPISQGQIRRLFGKMHQYDVSREELDDILAEFSFRSVDDVTRDQYDAIVDRIVRGGRQ